MNLEIERKFIVKEIPDIVPQKVDKIWQGYLPDSSRIRSINNKKYFITTKTGVGLTREEEELILPQSEFERLQKNIIHSVEKIRLYIPIDPVNIAEVDIFLNKYRGLITTEVEFDTLDIAKKFIPPVWFGEEVTNNSDYHNIQLSTDINSPNPLGLLIDAIHRNISNPNPYLVGVGGGSASGKSTLTKRIISLINSIYGEGSSIHFSLDNYFYPDYSEKQKAKGIVPNWDDPDAQNTELQIKHLKKLKNNQPIFMPIYNFDDIDDHQNIRLLHPAKVILVDGIFILHHKEINDLLDLRLFIHSSLYTRLFRRIIRDQQRIKKSPMQIFEQFMSQVHPAHEIYIAPQKEKADIVILSEIDPSKEKYTLSL